MAQAQLIYSSRPFGYSADTLDAILFSARHHNRRNGITGALICREDVFLQLLEGDADLVSRTFQRIARDGRHIEVNLLWTGPMTSRLFPDWEMRHDPARSWLWTPDEIWAGAIRKASPETLQSVFVRVASEPHDEDDAVL